MTEQSRRIRLISSLALVLGGLVSFMGILRHILEGTQASSTIYFLHFAGLFFISCHFYVKKTNKTEYVSFFLVFVGFIVISIRVLNTGGLSGMPIAWYIGIPSFAAFVQGHKWVMPWSIASVAGASLPLLFPNLVTGVHSPLVNYIVLALLILTVSSMMWVFEKQRLKNEVTIKKQTLKIVQSEKLISLGTLAGGMAHEINNPLAIIKGFSDSLKKQLVHFENNEEAYQKVSKTCEKIDLNVKRIANIIQNLLIFTKLGDKSQFEELLFSTIVRNSINENDSKFHGIKVSIIDHARDVKISCNLFLIQQVVLNLLCNSVESISELDEKWIELEIKKVDDFVKMSVTDSGKGIPKEKLNQLFEPFFTTKAAGSGTGLGLSICRNILQMHDGTLEFNQECLNTQFILTIPIGQNSQLFQKIS